ncbi:ABC transporter ATP-binding protein [Oceanobacillus jeddahense]|uniref:ABC transporter ATP-binding protein n=1 Tax=Oceanobacillus jeddahense TaxID=1462527 RepID=UPI000595C8C3|nr:ABC transporter ATP-binding protein [Oceanobacillus jeddahense]
MSKVFDIQHVSKVFDNETVALKEIDLSIEENEFVCFLGPSGCGKSTLLELLSGLEKPSEGKISFKEEALNSPNKKIGFVFQDASLYPWRTTMKNVEFGMELNGVSKKERRKRAQHYLSLVGLEGFEKKYPHQLSGGMRQRAGIARAFANQPDVLLMDEPFGALDHLTRIQLQKDLLEMWTKEKKTVVFVTHDIGEAIFLADRIVLFSPRPGKIKEIITLKQERPRDTQDPELIHKQNEIYASLQGYEENKGIEYNI